MAELPISNLASWLKRPHKVRSAVPDNDVLRKVMGGRVESHSRFREKRSHERKRNEDFGPPAWASHLYGPSSSKVEALSTPLSKSFHIEIQPSAIRNGTESKKTLSSIQFDDADKEYNDRVVTYGVVPQYSPLQRDARYRSTTRRSDDFMRKSRYESHRPVVLPIAVPSPQSRRFLPPVRVVPVPGRIFVTQHSSRTEAPRQHIPCDEPACTVISTCPSDHKYVPKDKILCVAEYTNGLCTGNICSSTHINSLATNHTVQELAMGSLLLTILTVIRKACTELVLISQSPTGVQLVQTKTRSGLVWTTSDNTSSVCIEITISPSFLNCKCFIYSLFEADISSSEYRPPGSTETHDVLSSDPVLLAGLGGSNDILLSTDSRYLSATIQGRDKERQQSSSSSSKIPPSDKDIRDLGERRNRVDSSPRSVIYVKSTLFVDDTISEDERRRIKFIALQDSPQPPWFCLRD